MKSFKGSKHSHAKIVAEELFNEMQESVSEGAELFVSEIYDIAKICAYKNLEINKLAILDGLQYEETNEETQAEYEFWELVGRYLDDIE